MIIAEDFDQAFTTLCKLLDRRPVFERRGMKIKELVNAQFKLTKPRSCIITNPERKLSIEYLKSELEWYKSGDLSVKNISKVASMWGRIADSEENVCSNYGYFCFKQQTPNLESQVDWVVRKLNGDKFTRQAVINYNQVFHKFEGNKDFVCTMFNQFLFNPETECLDMFCTMRSSDLVYGLSYDVPWFVWVFRHVCDLTNLAMGEYYHSSISLHCYEKHFGMAKRVSEQESVYKSNSLSIIE